MVGLGLDGVSECGWEVGGDLVAGGVAGLDGAAEGGGDVSVGEGGAVEAG